MDTGIIIAIITGVFAVFGTLITLQSKRTEKAEQMRIERNTEIGRLRNQRDEAESEKDEAHDALARQTARHIIDGNHIDILAHLAEEAEQAAEKFSKKKRELADEMERIWSGAERRSR
jgi:hypothetical protein